jgi:hypothetical protein
MRIFHWLIVALISVLLTLTGCGGGSGGGSGSNENDVQNEQQWFGTTDEGGEVSFQITDGQVEGFVIYAYLTGGSAGYGWLELAIDPAMPVSGDSFSFNGSLYKVSGTFSESNKCTGTWDYQDSYLGYSRGAWEATVIPVLSVTPTSQNVSAVQGSTSFTVTNTNPDSGTMTWTVEKEDQDDWLTIASGSSGTNSGTIVVDFDESIASDARVSTITIISSEAYNSPQQVEIRQNVYNPYIEDKILGTDSGWSDHFGTSVCIAGDYAVAGAPGDNERAGSAYVFARTGSTWVQQAKLMHSDPAEGDNFGASVSISSDYIIVGAPKDDNDSGSAYIFAKPASGWTDMTETAKLTGLGYNNFGSSVSISGNFAIVGAPWNNDQGSRSGKVYLFEKPATGWTDMTETAKLTANDGASYDYFGSNVAISGDTIVVSAFGNDDNGSGSGSAYIFEKPATGWTDMVETAKLTASDASSGDTFGNSVSIAGDSVIIGAHQDDDNGTDSGAAYIFEKPITGWTDMTETAKLTASDASSGDTFGNSVSIAEDKAIVGSINDDSNGTDSGSAYIFEKPASGWTDMVETTKVVPIDGSESDNFGRSVSISSDFAIVGSEGDIPQGATGSAYIYNLNTSQ